MNSREGEGFMSTAEDRIRKIIQESEHIVVLSGINVMLETGLNGVRAEHIAYEIEEQYGYSNDEIISSAFFSRRGDIFYDYYKNIILNKKVEPGIVHKAIRQLQENEQIDMIITRTIYELYEKAGCENVLDMHGSAEQNVCQSCGKVFGADHISQSKGMPLCDQCQTPLRPGFTLLGERVDNGKVTAASNAVEEADVLLIVGASLRSALCQNFCRYYTGNKMILINTEEDLGDESADYRLYGTIGEIVPRVTGYDENKKPAPKKKEAKAADKKKEEAAEKKEK